MAPRASSGSGEASARGSRLSHHQFSPRTWPVGPTARPGVVERGRLKAGSDRFFSASLALKFKVLVYLRLKLKGTKRENFTPRKRQNCVVGERARGMESQKTWV